MSATIPEMPGRHSLVSSGTRHRGGEKSDRENVADRMIRVFEATRGSYQPRVTLER
jgi:hypothetical protein